MKALYCQWCGDIVGLRANEVMRCRCGNSCAAWQNPVLGRAVFAGEKTEYVWCLGIHNGFLHGDNVDYGKTFESPIVRIRPGSSGDTIMLGEAGVIKAAEGTLEW